MASYETIESPLSGVEIYLNKVVSDERGHFCDLAETDNPAIKTIKHVHTAIALKRGVSRGEHYHHRVIEDFYILAGTALGILHDFNEKSPTFGKTYGYIAGNKSEEIKTDLPTFYIEDGKLAQFRVMPKIWHAWWPLTDKQAVIVAFGTHGYDPTDYEKPKAKEVPQITEILKKYNIE
jgi:dTDP-4-dehydrorhamnose 3,5-epimerase-like enzyme